jgi:hypothetical protein
MTHPMRVERIGEATMDKCDCCGCAMKYRRISPRYLYACRACRPAAMDALGVTVSAIAIGPAEGDR